MEEQAVIRHISQWMKTYAQEAGCKGFVVGVSGGIDSALTSCLAALTGMQTLLLEMPIHQHKDQVNRARRHMESLGNTYANVKLQKVELTEVYETFTAVLPETEENPQKSMALVNTRARLRMTTLYYFAGLNGLLVAGTGNKVEDFGVGFYTKYGDGGVDISPIADLLKTEVYALARALEVNEGILDAPPTDGLWGDDRTDEDQIGASYPELEWAMAQREQDKRAEDFEGRDREVMQIYLRLHRANQHKMQPIPVCKIPEALR